MSLFRKMYCTVGYVGFFIMLCFYSEMFFFSSVFL